MNCKINIDKFICFLIENKSDARQLLEICLKSQGLEYKDGEIVEIDNPLLTEEQKTDNEKGVKKDDDIYMYGRGINGETIYLTHGDVRQIFGELLEHPEKKEIYITHKDKPQTIKFKTKDEKIYQDKSPLFQDSFDGLKERINSDEECIELRDNTGEKVFIPKKKILERINEIRNEEDDDIWPKEIIEQLHKEVAESTPMVKAELRKYFANIFPCLYNVDVDKMTRDYSSGLLHSGYVGPSYFDRQIAYKRGIEDILELIKKGGEE